MKNYEKHASGKKKCTCGICGTIAENLIFTPKEMMQGLEEEFEYFICEACECMQIKDIPENIQKYYGESYYSFQMPEYANIKAEKKEQLKDYAVLDVGAGAGAWLCAAAIKGYEKLDGCDPFIEEDIFYSNGVKIKKCTIHEMKDKYDYIRLGDSLEHMSDPLEVMHSIKRILKKNGACYIHIPVIPNIAFDTFGIYWFQIDAPRHFFIHSYKSIEYLCQQAGLRINKVKYDSGNVQFIRSELYSKGYYYGQHTDEVIKKEISPQKLLDYDMLTSKANELKCGDHAIFEVVHNEVEGR